MSARVEIWKNGKQISSCKNLRTMIAYGHKHGVTRVELDHAFTPGTVLASIEFEDDAGCSVHFESQSVANAFFKKRQPVWGGIITGSAVFDENR